MSWSDIIKFFTNANRLCTILMVLLCVALVLGFAVDTFIVESFWTGRHPHLRTVFIFLVCFCGLHASVAASLIEEQLKEEVDHLSEFQAELALDMDRLEQLRRELLKHTHTLQAEVNNYTRVRQHLTKFRSPDGLDFKKILEKVEQVMGQMREVLKTRVRGILFKVSDGFELMHGQEDFTREVWEQFEQRLPSTPLARKMSSFDVVSRGSGVVTASQRAELIQQLTKDLDDVDQDTLFGH